MDLYQRPFEEIFEWMHHHVWSWLIKQTHNKELADEVFSDTALNVWRAIQRGEIREPERLPSYAYTVAKRLWWKKLIIEKRRKLIGHPDYRPILVVRSHEEPVIARVCLLSALPKISPSRRKALLDHPDSGPHNVNCQSMGRTNAAVRVLRWKAKQQLKKLLS